MPDQVIGGYRLGKVLGEGATAVVHFGERLDDGLEVAVKLLHPDLVEHGEMLARFRREARTLRELEHPNIVGFVDFVEEDPHYLFVMELLDGGTLEKFLSLKGKITEKRCLSWMIQLAAGLAAAHDKGVVHRDIKPANIFLTTTNKVVLSDFGLARPDGDNLTRAGTKMIGTPLYMAPEQILGRTACPATDVYQLALCMFEEITGERPFPSSNDYERMMARLDTPLELPGDAPASAELKEILRRAGACSPEDRYAHGQEMHQDMVALSEGRELASFGDEAVTLVGASNSGAPSPGGESDQYGNWKDPDAYEGTLLICPQVGLRYDPNGEAFFIGSDPQVEVVLESREIAPRQVRVKPSPSGWQIETGNFQAEALVDGERLTAGSRPLRHGSVITLAGFELLWICNAAPESPDAPADAEATTEDADTSAATPDPTDPATPQGGFSPSETGAENAATSTPSGAGCLPMLTLATTLLAVLGS